MTSFLAEHSIQGWCPPVLVFRNLGFRIRKEIDPEKYALKLMRGDFDGIEPPEAVADADQIAGRVLNW